MRVHAAFCAVTVMAAACAAAPAVAQAPERPKGNFGGGALAPPPKDLFGPGNAIVALRALPERRLEIEATVRGTCAGGDITVATNFDTEGRFSVQGSETQAPQPGEKVKVTYKLSGRFTDVRSVTGKLSATLVLTSDAAETKTCKTGSVTFGARRPHGDVGERGAKSGARYYGVTAQRGTGPRRPIVLRVSGDGERITRALFGEQVTCSDGKRSIGIEAPRTEIPIDADGKVSDRDRDTIDNGATVTHVDDRFTATVGLDGAKGTFSLSDRTVDKASGNVLQTCKSGTVKWTAAP